MLLLPALPLAWCVGAYAVVVLLLLWMVHRRAYGGSRLPPRSQVETSSGSSSGSVYVLTNPEYPGLVKIGYTTRSAEARAQELSAATGVPQPFEVAYAAEMSNPEAVETAVHRALNDRMVNPDREFFEVSTRTAVQTIRRAAGQVGNSSLSARTGPGRSSLVPAWLHVPLETGLGLALFLGALIAFVSILYSAPVSSNAPNTWTSVGSTGGLFSGSDSGVLGALLTTVGHTVGPNFLGVSGLFFVGMGGLWGYAMLRQRPRRPLRIPAALSLVASITLAGTMGWMGHQAQQHASLWTSGSGKPDALQAWSGTVGTAASGWLRAQLGSTVALTVLLLLLSGGFLLGLWWAFPQRGPGASLWN